MYSDLPDNVSLYLNNLPVIQTSGKNVVRLIEGGILSETFYERAMRSRSSNGDIQESYTPPFFFEKKDTADKFDEISIYLDNKKIITTNQEQFDVLVKKGVITQEFNGAIKQLTPEIIAEFKSTYTPPHHILAQHHNAGTPFMKVYDLLMNGKEENRITLKKACLPLIDPSAN